MYQRRPAKIPRKSTGKIRTSGTAASNSTEVVLEPRVLLLNFPLYGRRLIKRDLLLSD